MKYATPAVALVMPLEWGGYIIRPDDQGSTDYRVEGGFL